MKKYNYVRTTENLIFTVDLSYKAKSLGEASSDGDSDTYEKTNGITFIGTDRSDEVKSFDVDNPFIVGVNGVVSFKDDVVEYQIDGNNYTTNLKTKETKVVAKIKNEEYSNRNYFYDEDKIGVDGILKNIKEVSVERGRLSIVDKFSKFKNVQTTEQFEQIGNGFYKIIDQTIK